MSYNQYGCFDKLGESFFVVSFFGVYVRAPDVWNSHMPGIGPVYAILWQTALCPSLIWPLYLQYAR